MGQEGLRAERRIGGWGLGLFMFLGTRPHPDGSGLVLSACRAFGLVCPCLQLLACMDVGCFFTEIA